MSDQAPRTRQDSYSPRAVLLALALLVVLVLGGLFLFYTLRESSSLEDCVMQGRSNCTESSTTP
jgi:hypothetical protein